MLVQVIFLSALALFLILIIRRIHLSSGRISPFIARFIGFFHRIVTGVAAVWRSLRSVTGRLISGRGLRNDRGRRPAAHPERFSHEFWQDEALQQKPELLTHYEEGEALLKSRKYEEAERFFLMAATRSPKNARVYAKLGFIYLMTKNYTDAIESLKVAVKLDKYNPSRHYNLALAYWGNKDGQHSIASIREAISLDPVTPKYRQFLEELLNKK